MKLPILSGLEVIKLLAKVGFGQLDQHGSHVILVKEIQSKKLKVVVPLHNELALGTLLSIIKQSGLTRDEFLKLHYKK